MSIEDKLRQFIIYKFKTLQDFCSKSGMSQSTLSTILKRGICNTTTDKLFAICDTLGISADELARGKIVQKEINNLESLAIDEQELIDTYKRLSQKSKDIVVGIADDLLEIESNKEALILPFLNENYKTQELDYYDQAAGMGTGQIVEDAIPKKINILASKIPPNTDFIIRVYGDSMEPTFHSEDKLYIESTNILDPGDIGVFSFRGETLVKEYQRGMLISHNKNYEPIKIDETVYIQGKVLGRV